MKVSFGKAVKKAISREEENEEKGDAGHEKISLLANSTRQRIFQYMCKNPCSHLRQIARDLDMAVPTAEWHLNKFVENGILKAAAIGNKQVYYPSNMIDAKDVGMICTLKNEKTLMIYKAIISSLGISQKKISEKLNLYQQIVSSHTIQLEEAGLIESVKEGRLRRYFVAKHPVDVQKSYAKRRKHFRDWVLKVLKEEGLKPKVLRVKDWEMKVQIQSHGRTRVLRINMDPLSGLQ